MGKVTVNGRTVKSAGRSVVISNNRVIIDGADVTPDAKVITIHVEGDVGTIEADACSRIEVAGRVAGNIKTMSGDVRCEDVGGSVNSMSGDIECGQVHGSAASMSGDVRHGR